MSLTLYFHPLSSFCHKALIALYETGTPFTPRIVDLMGEAAEYRKIWPLGKIPVPRDADRIIPETSIIIEYLAQHYAGRTRLFPADPDLRRQMRLRDRFYDLYVNVPMQKIVTDRMRPEGKNDPYGVEEARDVLKTALGMIDQDMAQNRWAMGDQFTMADCAAAPALFYTDMVAPFQATHRNAAAYLDRLKQRPSYARVLEEAEPYFQAGSEIALSPRSDTEIEEATMTERSVTHTTFTLERTYDAPPAKVFKAFADPAIKRRWFAEGEGWEVEEFTGEFRIGGFERGRFRFRGGEPIRNDTSYLDIVPDARIILAYSMTIGEKRISSSLATFQFTPAGGGTRLVCTEQGAFLDGLDSAGPREAGWNDLLDTLGRALQA
jgi:glutathione S-transferase